MTSRNDPCSFLGCPTREEVDRPQTQLCAGCGLVRYCGRGCQISDWKGGHKAACRAAAAAREASAASSSAASSAGASPAAPKPKHLARGKAISLLHRLNNAFTMFDRSAALAAATADDRCVMRILKHRIDDEEVCECVVEVLQLMVRGDESPAYFTSLRSIIEPASFVDTGLLLAKKYLRSGMIAPRALCMASAAATQFRDAASVDKLTSSLPLFAKALGTVYDNRTPPGMVLSELLYSLAFLLEADASPARDEERRAAVMAIAVDRALSALKSNPGATCPPVSDAAVRLIHQLAFSPHHPISISTILPCIRPEPPEIRRRRDALLAANAHTLLVRQLKEPHDEGENARLALRCLAGSSEDAHAAIARLPGGQEALFSEDEFRFTPTVQGGASVPGGGGPQISFSPRDMMHMLFSGAGVMPMGVFTGNMFDPRDTRPGGGANPLRRRSATPADAAETAAGGPDAAEQPTTP